MRRSILIGLMAATAATALAAPARYAIRTQQVAAAIANMGVPVTGAQVEMLSDITASTANPHLAVQSLEKWGSDGVMVRLQCQSREECLPFIVRLQLKAGDPRPVLTASAQPAAEQEPAKRAAQATVRSGSPAVLVLEGPHVQIRVSVVCLEAGTIGQTIRATDPEHKQVYTGQVIADGLLKGRL